MKNYGCKMGTPHDIKTLRDTQKVKYEVCTRCGKKFRWNKSIKGRVDNVKYLEAHVRQFAQPGGATKAVFNRLYKPSKCIIHI